jgi:hypothetical protein
MKLTVTTLFRRKIYLFSFFVLSSAVLLSSLPAYSQIDYNYGVSKKGFRVGFGLGVTKLQSNWSASPLGEAGLLSLDYDLNQFFSIGFQGQGGLLNGTDVDNKFYYASTKVIFVSGSVGFKVAVGKFSDFKTSNAFEDALKRIYVGAGVGGVFSIISLTHHAPGVGLPSLVNPGLATGKVQPGVTGPKSNGKDEGSGVSIQVPINFGTNIALRGFLGNDRVELNPNLQYVFVLSPYFDGYQPNSQPDTANPNIKVNGDQAYFIGSLTLRFKF